MADASGLGWADSIGRFLLRRIASYPVKKLLEPSELNVGGEVRPSPITEICPVLRECHVEEWMKSTFDWFSTKTVDKTTTETVFVLVAFGRYYSQCGTAAGDAGFDYDHINVFEHKSSIWTYTSNGCEKVTFWEKRTCRYLPGQSSEFVAPPAGEYPDGQVA